MDARNNHSLRIEDGVAALPALAAPPAGSYADRLVALRDTLIVLSMQLVFRATMILRHLY